MKLPQRSWSAYVDIGINLPFMLIYLNMLFQSAYLLCLILDFAISYAEQCYPDKPFSICLALTVLKYAFCIYFKWMLVSNYFLLLKSLN